MPKTFAASRGASSFCTVRLLRIRRIQHCEPYYQYVSIRVRTQWTAHVRGSRGVILQKLTNEDVRKAVELFWSTFLAKSEDELNSYYAPGSKVFQIAMRRSREYFKSDTRMELKLGPIDVVLIGPDAGVASYTFQFQATGRDVGGGKRVAEKLELVRATHVFQRDSQGKFRIVHEHFSVPPA